MAASGEFEMEFSYFHSYFNCYCYVWEVLTVKYFQNPIRLITIIISSNLHSVVNFVKFMEFVMKFKWVFNSKMRKIINIATIIIINAAVFKFKATFTTIRPQ